MPAAERRRGKKAELDVVHYLKDSGFDAKTSRSHTGEQKGFDIVVDLPVAIEVKDHGRMDLSGWLAQVAESANGLVPIVWHKRRGFSNPKDWYVTMTGESFMRLVKR